jgi:hypothetical protein
MNWRAVFEENPAIPPLVKEAMDALRPLNPKEKPKAVGPSGLWWWEYEGKAPLGEEILKAIGWRTVRQSHENTGRWKGWDNRIIVMKKKGKTEIQLSSTAYTDTKVVFETKP